MDTVPPVAEITVPTTTKAGTEVTFRGKGSEDNVGVVNWTWSFEHNGSDVELYGVDVTFVFEVPGTYTVTLTVLDEMDLEGEATVDIWVKERDTVDDDDDDGNGKTIDYVPIIIAIVLIAVPLVLITVFVLMRRQQGPGQGPSDGSGGGSVADDGSEWEEYQ